MQAQENKEDSPDWHFEELVDGGSGSDDGDQKEDIPEWVKVSS